MARLPPLADPGASDKGSESFSPHGLRTLPQFQLLSPVFTDRSWMHDRKLFWGNTLWLFMATRVTTMQSQNPRCTERQWRIDPRTALPRNVGSLCGSNGKRQARHISGGYILANV